MDIFYRDKINAGTLSVVSIPQVSGQANLLAFTNPAPKGSQGTFIPGIIVTKLDYKQATNTQFQQSLENIIYVYSFGDQMGDLTVSGMAFPRVCGDGNVNGISELFSFYKSNRVSKEVSALRITFAKEVIRGFLVSMALSTVDPSAGIHTFSLLLKTIPAAFRSSASGGVPVSDNLTGDTNFGPDFSSPAFT